MPLHTYLLFGIVIWIIISFRLFTIEEDEEGDLETVAKLVRFTDDLCSVALTLSHSHVVIHHMVLNFYEVVSISVLYIKISTSRFSDRNSFRYWMVSVMIGLNTAWLIRSHSSGRFFFEIAWNFIWTMLCKVNLVMELRMKNSKLFLFIDSNVICKHDTKFLFASFQASMFSTTCCFRIIYQLWIGLQTSCAGEGYFLLAFLN